MAVELLPGVGYPDSRAYCCIKPAIFRGTTSTTTPARSALSRHLYFNRRRFPYMLRTLDFVVCVC